MHGHRSKSSVRCPSPAYASMEYKIYIHYFVHDARLTRSLNCFLFLSLTHSKPAMSMWHRDYEDHFVVERPAKCSMSIFVIMPLSGICHVCIFMNTKKCIFAKHILQRSQTAHMQTFCASSSAPSVCVSIQVYEIYDCHQSWPFDENVPRHHASNHSIALTDGPSRTSVCYRQSERLMCRCYYYYCLLDLVVDGVSGSVLYTLSSCMWHKRSTSLAIHHRCILVYSARII